MAINTKTYFTKSNTIVRGSNINLALNPIMELNYGKMLTRGLFYFDVKKIKDRIDDKVYPDMSKLKHVLHMTNAASVNDRKINCLMMDSEYDRKKQRAISFDLIFFLLPKNWDQGRGFDYVKDLYNKGNRGYSDDGSTWYKYRNYCVWDEEGMYTTDTLSRQLDLYTSSKGNLSDVIIGYQHFDKGNEPIILDITETVNKFITGELCNNGIGVAFSPVFEETETDFSQYVGFFTQHTNSFFEPYVETTYDDYINDDRLNFYLDKKNKLYFYTNIEGQSVNLDEMPVAEVNGVVYEAKQTTKGAYYIELELQSSDYEEGTMFYDVWRNIKYQGKEFPEVELSFVTKEATKYFAFGLPSNDTDSSGTKFIPYLYGITHQEKIRRGDIRKITVDCKVPYTTNKMYAVDNIEYRLYTKEGVREIDVIDYTKVERAYNTNFFLIDTNDLIPSRYYIDVRVKFDMEELYHRDALEFDIVNDVTEVYN